METNKVVDVNNHDDFIKGFKDLSIEDKKESELLLIRLNVQCHIYSKMFKKYLTEDEAKDFTNYVAEQLRLAEVVFENSTIDNPWLESPIDPVDKYSRYPKQMLTKIRETAKLNNTTPLLQFIKNTTSND